MRSAFPGARVQCECGAWTVVPKQALPVRPLALEDLPARAAPVHAPGPPQHPCPRCAHALVVASEGPWVCGACSGEFIGHAPLAEMLEAAKDEVVEGGVPTVVRTEAEGEVRYLSCPACHVRMNRMNFSGRSGIILDVCKEHGTWFDAGERERVVVYVRSHGLEVLSAPPSADLSPENAGVVHRAEALLQYQALSEAEASARALDLAEDVVSLLFWNSGLRRRW